MGNERIIDTLRGMQDQEKTYSLPEFMVEILQNRSSLQDSSKKEGAERVDLATYFSRRTQMIEWCDMLIDTCEYDKELVEITISLTDRYVATKTELMFEPDLYQLAVVASIYTAAKVHEESCLTPDQMEELADGKFTAEQIVTTELDILMALGFKVNPPTPSTFSRCLLELFPKILVSERSLLEDIIEVQLELALSDDFLITCKPSSLSCAVVMNALQTIPQKANISFYWDVIAQALHLDPKQSKASLINIRKYVNGLVLESLKNDEEKEEKEECISLDEKLSPKHSKQQQTKIYRGQSNSSERSRTRTYAGRAA